MPWLASCPIVEVSLYRHSCWKLKRTICHAARLGIPKFLKKLPSISSPCHPSGDVRAIREEARFLSDQAFAVYIKRSHPMGAHVAGHSVNIISVCNFLHALHLPAGSSVGVLVKKVPSTSKLIIVQSCAKLQVNHAFSNHVLNNCLIHLCKIPALN